MKLQLPRRRRPDRNDFDTSPEAVKRWVDDLPLVNTARTRQLLEDALGWINILDIPPQERFEALELLATPAMCVGDALKKSFLGRPIPLTGRALESANACIDTCRRMAVGYEILAEDLENENTGGTLLTIAIHRALRYLSEGLLADYQIYTRHPEGLWREIHTLYALAELKGTATRPVIDNTLPTTGSSAIDTVYKQILLLSLACPYQLRQNEIHYVYNALLDWAGYSRLAGADDTEIHGQFAVNLDADNPPVYRALGSESRTGDELRILDTRDLEGRLRDVLSRQSAGSGNRTGIGDTRTLQRLMLCWGVMPRRSFPREPLDEPVKLVVGLNNVHMIIQPGSGDSSAADDMHEQDAGNEFLRDPTLERATSINTGPARRDTFQHAAAETGGDNLRGAYVASAPDTARMESWKIADMSPGGYCLLHDSREASRARIGELVAIANRQEQDAGDWHLGVIRWMKFSMDRGLELGIQILVQESATAIWTSNCGDSVTDGSRTPGILLSGTESIGRQDILLLPSMPVLSDGAAMLENGPLKMNIQLTRQLENTGSFAQYHFTAAGEG
jgi:hypothetical protein